MHIETTNTHSLLRTQHLALALTSSLHAFKALIGPILIVCELTAGNDYFKDRETTIGQELCRIALTPIAVALFELIAIAGCLICPMAARRAYVAGENLFWGGPFLAPAFIEEEGAFKEIPVVPSGEIQTNLEIQLLLALTQPKTDS